MQRSLFAAAVRRFDHSGVDANLFRALRVHTKAGARLLAHFVLCLWCLDDVVGACGLLLGAHVHLAAVDDDVDVSLFAIVGAGVVAHDDRAVGTNHQR